MFGNLTESFDNAVRAQEIMMSERLPFLSFSSSTSIMTVKTNNAGGVLVSVNQEAAKEMGELGKPQEIKIAAEPNL